MMLVALGLGAVFGLLLTRTTGRLEGPISDIDRGLARREFRPFYQPIFELSTGSIVGCEVLARWIRGDGTVIPPMNFIPLAKSSGRIEPMTWQMLESALKEMQPRLREDKQFKLSINVVPRHMLSEGFIDTLRRVVLTANVSARQIVLEVTERNEMPDLIKAAAVVRQLREFGFRVAMDDVGVGHSGLSQMKALGANTIKIDKFFIDTITEGGSAATIVETLAGLARDLRMTVVAEGIETIEQVRALIGCGIKEGQGYFVSPPLPFAKFDELVEMRKSRAMPRISFSRPLGSHNSFFHHLAAKLASGIGRGVDVCIPFAGEEVGRLILGNRCRSFDGACHRLEGQNDSCVLSWFTGTMKMSAESRPRQILVSDGPG